MIFVNDNYINILIYEINTIYSIYIIYSIKYIVLRTNYMQIISHLLVVVIVLEFG